MKRRRAYRPRKTEVNLPSDQAKRPTVVAMRRRRQENLPEVSTELADLQAEAAHHELLAAPSRDRALYDIDHCRWQIDMAQERLVDAVAEARDFGVSWSEIARRLGISRQAVQQRFGGE